MDVLVTGASGLVGSALARALAARGDAVIALSREPHRHHWPAGVRCMQWDGKAEIPDVAADAVVNLAGRRVVGGRWTAQHMRELRESRLAVTRRVVEWVNAKPKPPTLVSASAAGYYGYNAKGPCLEERPPGSGFLADLARDWEREAGAARGRRVILRLGHVLAREGGYFATLLPFVRRHLAGSIAGGRQPMPWVHIDDVVAAILWSLDEKREGVYNVVSPGAAHRTQAEFSAAVAAACGKRGQLAVPLWAIRLRYGAGAGPALAGGQDLRADRLLAAGFRFRHVDLQVTVRSLSR